MRHFDNVIEKLFYEDVQRRRISYIESNNSRLKLNSYHSNNSNEISNN